MKEPRRNISSLIQTNKLNELLELSASFHGHYCPGLALGVIAGAYAMNKLKAESDGMEELIAITETNNCFSDGIQFVTGCTFGNNALNFHDLGKTAFTLSKRDGIGIRLVAKDSSKQEIRNAFPEFSEIYEQVVKNKDRNPEALIKYKEFGAKRAYKTLEIPIEKLFDIQKVKINLPDYAPSHESVVCNKCGESTMITRTKDGVCFSCSGENYLILEREGIRDS